MSSFRYLFASLFGVALMISLTESMAETNYFENGDLEGGLELWKTQSSGEPCEVTPTGPEAAPAMTFKMPEDGKRTFDFYQDTDLSLAETFKVVFWARSDSPVNILVAPQRRDGDYGAIGSGATASIGTEWKEYHLTIKITEATSNGRLTFLPMNPIPSGLVQFSKFRLEIAP